MTPTRTASAACSRTAASSPTLGCVGPPATPTSDNGLVMLLMLLPWVGRDGPQDPCWVTCDDRVCRHIARHDAAGADDGTLANDNVRENGRARADRRAFANERGFDFPILLSLKIPVDRCRTRIRIVDEGDAVSDKDVILDGHALADERMARDFAAAADRRVLLDVDERADF